MTRIASYEVYVEAGEAEERFRVFMAELGDKAEINWRDTEDY